MAAERYTYRGSGFRGDDPRVPREVGESFTRERTIASGTWSRVSSAAAADPRVSHAAMRVLCALGRYADADGKCYPAVASIAEIVGTNPRQVRIHLGKLERLGYLLRRRQRRARGGGWSVNLYTLRFPPPPPLPKRTPGESEPSGGTIGLQEEMRMGGPPDANERNMSSDDTSGGQKEQNEQESSDTSCRSHVGNRLSETARDLSLDDSRTSPSKTSPVKQQPNFGNASPRDPDGRGSLAVPTPAPQSSGMPAIVPLSRRATERACREAAARLHGVMVEHGGWARVWDDPYLAAAYERALDAEAEIAGAGVAELRQALLEAISGSVEARARQIQQEGTGENADR